MAFGWRAASERGSCSLSSKSGELLLVWHDKSKAGPGVLSFVGLRLEEPDGKNESYKLIPGVRYQAVGSYGGAHLTLKSTGDSPTSAS